MRPVMKACIVNQPRGHWLLSDAFHIALSISTACQVQKQPPAPNHEGKNSFELELHMLKVNMKNQIVKVPEIFLDFVVIYTEDKDH